jgi:hypothetical protein
VNLDASEALFMAVGAKPAETISRAKAAPSSPAGKLPEGKKLTAAEISRAIKEHHRALEELYAKADELPEDESEDLDLFQDEDEDEEDDLLSRSFSEGPRAGEATQGRQGLRRDSA